MKLGKNETLVEEGGDESTSGNRQIPPPAWKALDYIDFISQENSECTSYTSLIYNFDLRELTIEKMRRNTQPNTYKLLCYFETNI